MYRLTRRDGLRALAAALVTAGCSTDSEPPFDAPRIVVRDTASNVLLPSIEAFGTAASELKSRLAQLYAAPSAELLVVARDAWRRCRAAWRQTSVMHSFGPIYDGRLEAKIDFWPVRVTSVDTAIADATADLTGADVYAQGATVQGLPALEYVLFGDRSDSEQVDYLKTVVTGVSPCAYAVRVGEALVLAARDCADGWSTFGVEFQRAGKGSKVYARSLDALNALLNGIIAVTQRMTDLKLGKPLGSTSGGTPAPDLLESRFADNMAADLLSDVASVRSAYLGRRDERAGRGIADLVKDRDAALDRDVQRLLDTADAKLEALPRPATEVIGSQPGSFEVALGALTDVRRVFTADVVGVLGGTVSISDNDGD